MYVLTGNHTASASEIILNNLKPFINIISIGEKTKGKDATGFAIEDNRMADKKGWVLCPVIYKLFNANNKGNYALGISPTVELNELEEIEIFPLGDIRETLLNQALSGAKNFRQKKHSMVKKLLLNKNCIDTDPFLQIHL